MREGALEMLLGYCGCFGDNIYFGDTFGINWGCFGMLLDALVCVRMD